MYFTGIALGLFSVMIIGFGFVWVIRGEYYLGYFWWPYPLILGLVLIAISLFVPYAVVSALLGIAGASAVWGATEMKEQAVRVDLGWFRRNPRRKPAPPFVDVIKKIDAPHL